MADDTRYAYAVARIRGMETRLLDRQWIERLLSETADGVLKALSDSAYQEALGDVARPEDLERGLVRAMAETLRTVSAIAPEPELIDLFRVRWDFRNLKSLLKASFVKLEGGEIGTADGVGTVDLPVLEKAVAEHDYMMVPDFLAEAARAAEEVFRDHGELALVDRVLDGALWEHSLSVARAARNAFVLDFLRTEIDLANVRTFARLKDAGRDRADLSRGLLSGGTLDASFFEGAFGESMDVFARVLEYGRYGALAPVFRDWSRDKSFALELACDNLLLAKLELGKTVAYGIEPLIAFIVMREIEMKLVRAAVVAKLDGVERAEVEARLRSIHV